MDNQRGLAPVIIVLIIVALLAGGILAWQYWWMPKEEVKVLEEAVKDKTADWKTYRNERFSYELKYPPYLIAEEQGMGPTPITPISKDIVFIVPTSEYPKTGESLGSLSIWIPGITSEEANLSLRELVAQSTTGFIKREEIKIGNNLAIKLVFSKEQGGEIEVGTKKRTEEGLVPSGEPYFGWFITEDTEVIFIKHPFHNDIIFLITYHYQNEDIGRLFNDMLSTFKFLE